MIDLFVTRIERESKFHPDGRFYPYLILYADPWEIDVGKVRTARLEISCEGLHKKEVEGNLFLSVSGELSCALSLSNEQYSHLEHLSSLVSSESALVLHLIAPDILPDTQIEWKPDFMARLVDKKKNQ